MKEKTKTIVRIIAALSLMLTIISRAADTLPAQLSDAAYWKMISDFSEPDGYYEFNVYTGNEPGYQDLLPDLTKSVPAGGTYLGVGPEQNFTYIAALRPKIAFIIDIRRDMMLEHLMYKAVFEMSSTRAEFVGKLFSRQQPSQLTADSPVQSIFQAYATTRADPSLAEEHFKNIMARLRTMHGFAIAESDERRIRSIYLTFAREGVVNFMSSLESPGYMRLMTTTDRAGRNWSYLASNENFDRVRTMHEKNLIVPLVADFAGPKTLRMIGQYLRDHGAIVNVFYVSNVEDYIQQKWAGYSRNMASLPIDSSSVLVRWSIGSRPPWPASIADFIRSWSR
jgi:hypothetical protein